MSRLSAVSACLILTATAALAQSSATKKFFTQAIEGNYAEVQMGELAQKNGQREGVNSFGKMLIDDHGQANQKAVEEARSHREAGRLRFGVAMENAIAPLLPHGRARADEIACQLGMSLRTLERRLGSQGLTFTGILSELRVDLAKRYLLEEDLAISKIAWLLGYQDVTAFTHAFKRSTASRQEKPGHKRMLRGLNTQTRPPAISGSRWPLSAPDRALHWFRGPLVLALKFRG